MSCTIRICGGGLAPCADTWVSAAGLAQICYQNQLCNSYMAFNTNYHDTGLFGVYTSADKDAPIADLSWAIMQARSCLACTFRAQHPASFWLP